MAHCEALDAPEARQAALNLGGIAREDGLREPLDLRGSVPLARGGRPQGGSKSRRDGLMVPAGHACSLPCVPDGRGLPGLILPGDDVVAEGDALVADLDVRPRDQLPHLAARLAAERATIVHLPHQVSTIAFFVDVRDARLWGHVSHA